MADANMLTRAGLAGPLAIEIAAQMNAGAGNGNVNRLMALGVPGMQATELVAQINAGAFAAHRLTLATWPPDVARALKVASGL